MRIKRQERINRTSRCGRSRLSNSRGSGSRSLLGLRRVSNGRSGRGHAALHYATYLEQSKAYLVLGGEGWKLRDFYTGSGLEKHLENGSKEDILTLEGFIAGANQDRL